MNGAGGREASEKKAKSSSARPHSVGACGTPRGVQ